MQHNKHSGLKSVGEAKIYDYDPDLSKHPIPPHLHAVPESASNRLDKYLMHFERMLNWLFRTLMILAGLGLAFLMFAQVIMRYVLESPFTGIEEASILLAVWIYFLGMGYATREREHIHGGIVSLVVKDPFKVKIIRFFGSITCMIAAIIFAPSPAATSGWLWMPFKRWAPNSVCPIRFRRNRKWTTTRPRAPRAPRPRPTATSSAGAAIWCCRDWSGQTLGSWCQAGEARGSPCSRATASSPTPGSALGSRSSWP